MRIRLIETIGVVLLSVCGPTAGLAQQAETGGARPPSERRGDDEDRSTATPVYDLAVSKVFRSVSAVVPISRRFTAEVHAFGRSEEDTRENVVQSTISYQVPVGRFGFIAPGVGYYFGAEHEVFSASLRWFIEAGPVVTEGFLLQGLGTPEGSEHAQIWDGNHVSLSMLHKRLEVGPSWEHISIRDVNEWKWGGRAAARVHERVALQLYVLTPGTTEWRAGFLIR